MKLPISAPRSTSVPRRRRANGPERRVVLHPGFVEHAVGAERDAIPEGRVGELGTRPDHAPLPDHRAPGEAHAGMEHGVAADGHGRVDVRRRRIDHRDPGGHERVERARAQEPFERRELPAVVDAGDLARVRHAHGLDPAPAPRQLADHVRQVHLALRVGRRVPGDGLERRPQAARVEAVDPRVALAAAPLGRRRVALLDDGADTAIPAAADAPVAGGIGRHERQEGGRRARRPMAREERGEGRPVEKRHVTVEEQELGGRLRHLGPRPAEGVSRAPGFRLLHEAGPEVGERRSDGVGAGGHDDHRPRDPGLPHERDRIADQRLSPQQMEDLGPTRPHALALARGEDHGPGLARDGAASGAAHPGRPRHGPSPAAGRDRRAG